MKLVRFQKNNTWVVRLIGNRFVYQGEGKTLKEAMRQAFGLLGG